MHTAVLAKTMAWRTQWQVRMASTKATTIGEDNGNGEININDGDIDNQMQWRLYGEDSDYDNAYDKNDTNRQTLATHAKTIWALVYTTC